MFCPFEPRNTDTNSSSTPADTDIGKPIGCMYGCLDPGDGMILNALVDLGLEAQTVTVQTEDGEYWVPLEYMPCNFGGYRPWFRCPGVVNGERCGRRCRKLYLLHGHGTRYYLCQECYDLAYRSSRTSGKEWKQAELRYRQTFAKADARNHRPHPNNTPFIPERPKGMCHDTFEEHVTEVRIAEMVWTEQMRKETNRFSNTSTRTAGSSILWKWGAVGNDETTPCAAGFRLRFWPNQGNPIDASIVNPLRNLKRTPRSGTTDP